MASYTTNLNLKKPAGSENVAIGDINNNMDTIDQAYGTLNSNVKALKNHFAVSSNNTETVTLIGTGVLVTGHASVPNQRGIYMVGANIVSPIIEASNLSVSVSNGVLSITNSGSSTATCLLLFNNVV